MTHKKTILAIAILFSFIFNNAIAQVTNAGASYRGTIKSITGNVVTIDLLLYKAEKKAQISSSMGVSNLMVSVLKLDTDSLVFEVPAYKVTYKGFFDHQTNNILGNWNQGASSVVLNFEQIQHPASTVVKMFTEQEVEIKTGVNILLSGTLTMPKGDKQKPAIVLLGVAGKTDRDQTFGPFKSFKTIADCLANEGFVVLRCDDRGVGKSTGLLYEAGYEDLVSDATAMISFLKNHPLVDPTKIGALGISEGAALTGILAGKQEIDFGVMLSYPATQGSSIIKKQIQDLSNEYGFTKDQTSLLLTDFDIVSQMILNSQGELKLKDELEHYLNSYTKELKDLTKYFLVPQDVKEAVDLYAGVWYRSQLTYDPTSYQKNIQCPVLILYGENDPFVNPVDQLTILDRQLRKPHNKKTVIKKMSGINHIFQDATKGSPLEYIKNGNDFSSRALSEIVLWLKSL